MRAGTKKRLAELALRKGTLILDHLRSVASRCRAAGPSVTDEDLEAAEFAVAVQEVEVEILKVQLAAT